MEDRRSGGEYVLKVSAFQNGSWLMAKRLPMIDTGMVDPAMENSIDGNCVGVMR